MTMEQAFKTFVEESCELLQEMEDRLLDVNNDSSEESINSIFRAAHTIKGSAGLFGLEPIVAFTHRVESVLDMVRVGELALDEDLVGLLLRCKDYMQRQIDCIDGGELHPEEGDAETESGLVTALQHYLGESGNNDQQTEAEQSDSKSLSKTAAGDSIGHLEVLKDGAAQNSNWHISVHFFEDVLRNGMDPLSFIRYLGTIGSIENIVTLFADMPSAEQMDPESCYLKFEINFNSDADKSTIEEAFEFVKDDCLLHIIPPYSRVEEFINIIDTLSSEELKLGEILVRCGTLTDRELDEILLLQELSGDTSESRPLLGELVVEDQLADPLVVEAALKKQDQIKRDKSSRGQSVRVDAEKLDTLINLIGELVIAGASVESGVRAAGIESLSEAALPMVRLIEEVRDSALNLRMVQIGDTFNRFQRVVRDVSKELNKSIELKISGGDTELDKSVIEKITDPLTHLVRNAIDHGIESPETRVKAGKSETGTLHLNAFHESGSIVIEVADDGAGLNCDRILAKAYEKGLVASDIELNDNEIYQLIFEAGFSTASEVSNISGRGVGMDVVKRNIEALRGTIEIDSAPGKGTMLRIRLPLTLAIIDGFMMGVGGSSYVVPLDIVEECIELTGEERSKNQDRNFINLRGEVLPFVRLRDVFQESGKRDKRENIVVVRYGNQKAGFVVDRLMGELQTVIKPLGSLFQHLNGISGSTILGSGEVALILDAPALINMASKQETGKQQTSRQDSQVLENVAASLH